MPIATFSLILSSADGALPAARRYLLHWAPSNWTETCSVSLLIVAWLALTAAWTLKKHLRIGPES